MIFTATEHAIERFQQRVCDEFDVQSTRRIIETLALTARVLPDKGRRGYHIRQIDKPLCQFRCVRHSHDHHIIVIKTIYGPKEIENERAIDIFENKFAAHVTGLVLREVKPLKKNRGHAELVELVNALVEQKIADEIDKRLDQFVKKMMRP